jgi:hypothetical protein
MRAAYLVTVCLRDLVKGGSLSVSQHYRLGSVVIMGGNITASVKSYRLKFRRTENR